MTSEEGYYRMSKVSKRTLYEERLKLLKELDPTNPEIEELEQKIKLSKRGRASKNKGATYEREIAKKFKDHYGIELVRTPQSGGFAKKSTKADSFRGDIITVDKDLDLKLHIECKSQKTWQLKSWIEQSQDDCPEGKVPTVIMKKQNTNTKVTEKGNQQDLVVIDLNDFFRLVDKDKIVEFLNE